MQAVSPRRTQRTQRKARRKTTRFRESTAALALTAADVLMLLVSYVEILCGANYAPLG
jgi:hypothetical protein